MGPGPLRVIRPAGQICQESVTNMANGCGRDMTTQIQPEYMKHQPVANLLNMATEALYDILRDARTDLDGTKCGDRHLESLNESITA